MREPTALAKRLGESMYHAYQDILVALGEVPVHVHRDFEKQTAVTGLAWHALGQAVLESEVMDVFAEAIARQVERNTLQQILDDWSEKGLTGSKELATEFLLVRARMRRRLEKMDEEVEAE